MSCVTILLRANAIGRAFDQRRSSIAGFQDMRVALAGQSRTVVSEPKTLSDERDTARSTSPDHTSLSS